MDLVCSHIKNEKIHVNGNVYDVGADGVCKDVKDVDAQKMLKGSWEKYTKKGKQASSAPKNEPSEDKATEEKGKRRGLLGGRKDK